VKHKRSIVELAQTFPHLRIMDDVFRAYTSKAARSGPNSARRKVSLPPLSFAPPSLQQFRFRLPFWNKFLIVTPYSRSLLSTVLSITYNFLLDAKTGLRNRAFFRIIIAALMGKS
jgi:hypothetical protein